MHTTTRFPQALLAPLHPIWTVSQATHGGHPLPSRLSRVERIRAQHTTNGPLVLEQKELTCES